MRFFERPDFMPHDMFSSKQYNNEEPTTQTSVSETSQTPEVESNTSEIAAEEATNASSNYEGFDNNFTEPTDYSWITQVSVDADEDTTKKDEYPEGFNPEYYEYAQELVGDEYSSFNFSKNEAKKAYDKAQESVDTAKDKYESALDRYNEAQARAQAEAKEWAEKYGFENVKVDVGVSNPGTLEEFTQKYVDAANKAKEEYSKYENDSKVFQDYLDKYKEDWDKYQSTQPKEEIKENRNLFSEAIAARWQAEQAATRYLWEKYGDKAYDYMPDNGWTLENCQEIVDAVSKASNLTEADGKEILDAISKANRDVAAVTNDPEGVKRTEALTSADTTLADGTKITNVSPAVGNGIGIQIESPNGNKTVVYAQESGTPNFWNFTVKERQPGSEAPETIYEKEHIATAVLQKEISKQISEQINKNSSPVDPKLVELAKNVIEANANVEKAREEETAARDSRREEANRMKNDAFEAYKNGEISAVEFANLMNKAKDISGTIDLVYTEPLLAKEEIELPSGTEYGKIVAEFQYLNSIKDKVNNINVNEVKDEAQAKTIQNDLVETQAQLIEQSHAVFTDIVRELVSQGIELKDIRNSDQIKGFSQEVFELAQSIYDKASILEEKAKALGLDEYAEPGRWNKIKTTANAAFQAVLKNQPMNKDEAYAVMTTMDSIEGVKDASKALMKSAAFNGATDVKGGAASETMKEEAVTKLTWKDWASTSIYGGLGILASAVGIAIGNPALIAAGVYVNLKKGGEFASKTTMTNVTNRQQMFGMEDSQIMNPAIQVYNQSQEKANIGDPRSASTYVTSTQGALEIASGLLLLPMPGATAIGLEQMKSGIATLDSVSRGGLSGNTKTMVENIYQLAQKVSTWSGEDFGEEELLEVISSDTAEKSDAGHTQKSSYGTSSGGSASAKGKYSGYREQAKDSNLATDYNQGMEKETNEAVSDKYVKIFKTILTNEPEHIRKVLMEMKK